MREIGRTHSFTVCGDRLRPCDNIPRSTGDRKTTVRATQLCNDECYMFADRLYPKRRGSYCVQAQVVSVEPAKSDCSV